MKNYPYVYKVINQETNEFYIGYREANKLSPEEDIVKYKTSSLKVKPIFEQFTPYIIAVFFSENSGDDAYWFEQQLIKENIDNPLCLNGYYIEPNVGNKKFKSKKGRKISDETKRNISIARKKINPETGLTNAQETSKKSIDTKIKNGSYKTGAIKANETKLKNNSNIIGGKKSSITKNTIDSETGLTNAQLAGIKCSNTKNTIDSETGLTNAQLSGLKGSITKNTIDSETGLTNAQLSGLKLKETLKKIDPETGLTIKQKQIIKSIETRRLRGSQQKDKHPNAKIFHIYNDSGSLLYIANGNFHQLCLENNLPYAQLMKSYSNNGAPITGCKRVEFNGWFALRQT